METRFGHDLSGVRIHTGSRASESVQAVNARAYTVGRHIAFDTGEYAPHTPRGRGLLAHELVHTIQQGVHGRPAPGDTLPIGARDDAGERQANAVAASASRPAGAHTPGVQRAAAPVLQRNGTKTPPPAHVCGPDVTSEVAAAAAGTRTLFAGWSNAEKEESCDALDSYRTGGYAWDIVQLHNNAWIHRLYRPACATVGATPPCGSTVQVGSECYYAGSANYVIFGVMCKACADHFTSVGNRRGARRFSKRSMQDLIDLYKGTGFFGISTPSANFVPSSQWAEAGYDGWPAGGTPPPGDRSNCTPTCSVPYSGAAFQVNWHPHSWHTGGGGGSGKR